MIFVLIAVLIFLIDLMAKKYVESNVGDDEEKEIPGCRIKVRKVHNNGLAMGMLKKWPKLAERLTFAALAATAVRALAGKKSAAAKTGYAILMGGALSNWYDRFHQGYVTDYLHVPTKIRPLQKVFFNLGDAAILIGGLLTLIPRREKTEMDGDTDAE
jgi:signal peptidase II